MSSQDIEVGSFAPTGYQQPVGRRSVRVVYWNINRGCCFDQILDFLSTADADLILLQECDRNAWRTNRRNVAADLARGLNMHYAFGVEFEELSQGDNDTPAHHGQATLCRWPLSNSRVLRFTHQSNFWKPRWFLPPVRAFQRRLGGRMALVSEISLDSMILAIYNLHLESRNGDTLRYRQLAEVLEDTQRYGPEVPIVVAGDFNFDVTRSASATAIKDAAFLNPFANCERDITPQSATKRSLAIDWILVRALRSEHPQVHSSTSGSDHRPRSLTLRF